MLSEDTYIKHEDVDGQDFVVNVMDTFEKVNILISNTHAFISFVSITYLLCNCKKTPHFSCLNKRVPVFVTHNDS